MKLPRPRRPLSAFGNPLAWDFSQAAASAFTVHHKARWYYQDGYDVNDWWVCYWPNYQSWDEGSAGYSLVYYPGLGYDAGQGFHYGFSSAGCVAIPDYDSALYIYATVPEGSSVIIF